MIPIRFVTANRQKSDEVIHYMQQTAITILPCHLKSCELQTDDLQIVIRDKVLKAFQVLGRPVFVECSGLYMQGLDDFPAGLTHLLWQKLGHANFARLFGHLDNSHALIRSMIGFCDGHTIHLFQGELTGTLQSDSTGDSKSDWNNLFIPDGHQKTLAELLPTGEITSPRQRALEQFCLFLQGSR